MHDRPTNKALAFLVLSVALATSLAAQQPTETIRGVVLDSATMTPVANVAYYIDGSTLAGQTDASGEFRLIELELGRHALVLLKDGFSPRILSFDLDEQHEGEVDVGMVLLSPGPAPTARISGVVTDAVTDQPVFGMELSVNGNTVAVSDLAGRFAIPSIAVQWGANHIAFRRIGYSRAAAELWTAQDTTDFNLEIKLDPVPLLMPEVVVEGERTVYYFSRLREFERRRRRGSGHFLTRQDIADQDPAYLSDMLARLPGVSVSPSVSGRYTIQMMRQGRRCSPAYFVDGIPFPMNEPGERESLISNRNINAARAVSDLESLLSSDDLQAMATGDDVAGNNIESMLPGDDIEALIAVEDIAAIEVYKGPAQIPVEFNAFGEECGVISIWTR
jgi:hypothetical protein